MTAHMFVLIMAIMTTRGGTPVTIQQEFTSYNLCMRAGKALTVDAVNRTNFVLTWGCFDTGKPISQSGGY